MFLTSIKQEHFNEVSNFKYRYYLSLLKSKKYTMKGK